MEIKPDRTEIVCPHCGAKRIGWRVMANHVIHSHPDKAEAGAAHTSPKRFQELLSNCVKKSK